jgi:3-oxoacyl-(acyl-carrier-protein) synthase III
LLRVGILGTGSALPARRVTTAELVAEVLPNYDASDLERRIGIRQRYWLAPGETAASLGAGALRAALERANLDARSLRRIILVTSTGGDHMIPSTANGIAAELGIEGSFDAFDLNNSCAGFLSGFDLAARTVATGVAPVAVVAVETFSRHVSPAGRRAYLVLGDAAAAVVLGAARSEEEGLHCSILRSTSALRGRMVMDHPGSAGSRGYHDFDTANEDIVETAITLLTDAVTAALDAGELGLADLSFLLPHQPNGQIVELLTSRLGISADKLVPIYPDIGSVGAASVPFSLDRLLRERTVRPGDRVLLTAVGSGTAYGAVIYRFGQ